MIQIKGDGTYASAQYTAQHIPGARFVGYDRGGHVWLGHHREIIDETVGFVLSAPDVQDTRVMQSGH